MTQTESPKKRGSLPFSFYSTSKALRSKRRLCLVHELRRPGPFVAQTIAGCARVREMDVLENAAVDFVDFVVSRIGGLQAPVATCECTWSQRWA